MIIEKQLFAQACSVIRHAMAKGLFKGDQFISECADEVIAEEKLLLKRITPTVEMEDDIVAAPSHAQVEITRGAHGIFGETKGGK